MARRPPSARLAAYVADLRFVVIPANFGQIDLVSEPTACTEIVVVTRSCMTDHHPNGTRPRKPRDFVFGTMSSERVASVNTSNGSDVRAISIVLKPGIQAILGRASGAELRDRIVPAEALLPRACLESLRHALSSDEPAPPWREVERSMLSALEGVELPDMRFRRMATAIASGDGDEDLASLASACGLSTAHAERLFAQFIGMCPNELQRIHRFRRVARHRDVIQLLQGGTLARVARSMGYSDHAHMTRDFRELAGIPLSGYAAKRARSLHLAQPAAST